MNTAYDEPANIFQIERCDLCIVGAGIAGMNALFAASQYLERDSKVVLIDKKATVGGMWTHTYDYVRLHQPHQMFTAGNIPWAIDKPPGYLATKDEVLDQFNNCVHELRTKVELKEFYGYSYKEHREVALGDGYEAQIVCSAGTPGAKPLLVKAKKCIKAFGFNIPKNPSLPLSSSQVRSISPNDEDVFGDELQRSDAPVYVVGGGKTGMDTAHALVSRYPDKDVSLIVGNGTVFASRDISFPDGLKRWWGPPTTLQYFMQLCRQYTGDNPEEIFEKFRLDRSVHLEGAGGQYMFGVLSNEENATIANGIDDLIRDYVTDVNDIDGQPTIQFRSGETKSVTPGSWFINCTGYVMRDTPAYEPFISAHGTVVSVQPTSGIHFLTTFAAYFLTHLFYLGQLKKLPLYEMDYPALLAQDKVAFPFAAMTQVLYNITLIISVVPNKVMADCGLDFDRWFPLHRRLLGGLKLQRNREKLLKSYKNTLDTVREKYHIRCGQLTKPETVTDESSRAA